MVAAEELEILQAPAHWGVVKFFNPSKGFGFLKTDDLPGDVKFGASDIPAELRGTGQSFEGSPVAFDVIEDDKGHRAKRVSFVIIQDGATVLPTLWGQVKRFDNKRGFGFIKSAYVDGDVIFGWKDIPVAIQGRDLKDYEVSFDVTQSDKGTRATNLAIVLPLAPPTNGRGGPLVAMGTPQSTGAIVNFNFEKGFGFIRVDHLGVDAYFKAENLVGMSLQQCAVGCPVHFDLQYVGEKPQARNVRPAHGGWKGMSKGGYGLAPLVVVGKGEVVAPPAKRGAGELVAPPPKKLVVTKSNGNALGTHRGIIAQFNEAKGFGFIKCQSFAADTFFHRQHLEGSLSEKCKQGQAVSFDVEYSPQGQPHGRRIRSLVDNSPMISSAQISSAQEALPVSPLVGKTLTGQVKNFKPGTFGFITCGDVYSDVWFGVVSLADRTSVVEIGGEVTFVLAQKADGRLIAEDNSVKIIES